MYPPPTQQQQQKQHKNYTTEKGKKLKAITAATNLPDRFTPSHQSSPYYRPPPPPPKPGLTQSGTP